MTGVALRVTYDIVGCGAVVQMYHAPVLRQLMREGRAAVRGCFDLNISNAERVGGLLGAGVVGTGVAPDGHAEAVLIGTPPDSHAEIARRCLEAGTNVLVEKPVAPSLTDLQGLIALASRHNRRLLVGHFRRFYPSLATAREFLSMGGLGRVRRVEATEGLRWEWAAASDYFATNPRGGVVWDTGSHVLDMVLFALSLDDPGIPLDVEVQSINRVPDCEPCHDLRAEIVFSAPAMAPTHLTIALSRVQALAGAVKFYGEGGVLIVPTAFADCPSLMRGRERFLLTPAGDRAAAADSWGCFLLEHQEFWEACTSPSAPDSRLDAQHFVGLTALLERLSGPSVGE